MSAVIYAIHATGITNADMVRAPDSLLTKNKQKAPSLTVHARKSSGHPDSDGQIRAASPGYF